MKISVLTCVRDQEPGMFASAARSVSELNPDCEWIIVDDGSQPDFRRSQKDIALRHGPAELTHYVELPSNRGLSVARNVALSLARGEWVVVLDSDDELTSAVATVLRRATESTGLIAFAADYFTTQPDWCERRPIQRYADLYTTYGGTVLDPFLWFDFYYHGIVARRAVLSAIGGYDESLQVGEDQDVLLRVAERTGRTGVSFRSEIGYRYRKNPAGVCATRWMDVVSGYTRTMHLGARRRGANFTECRHGGSCRLDDAEIDCYEYADPAHGWLDWKRATEIYAREVYNAECS